MNSHEQYLLRNAAITMNTMFVEDHHSIDVFDGETSITFRIGGSSISFLCGSPDHLRMFVNQVTIAMNEILNKKNQKENHVH